VDLTFAAFLASAILVLAGRRTARRLLAVAASGLLFLVLSLMQPGLVVALPLVALVWLAVAPRGPTSQPAPASGPAYA
jgi:hypothetical protein